jgi:hypothetical protein
MRDDHRNTAIGCDRRITTPAAPEVHEPGNQIEPLKSGSISRTVMLEKPAPATHSPNQPATPDPCLLQVRFVPAISPISI